MILTDPDPRSRRWLALAGLGVALASFVVYLACARGFDANRGDFYYLADAFLHGKVWLDAPLGPLDVIYGENGRVYVPFAPFPAFLFMPLVAVAGAARADAWEPLINAGIAASGLLLAWLVAARIGVRRGWDRAGLVVLLGFGTQMWWVTTRGGVWHTGHLVALVLAMLILLELFGRQRALLLGLLVGASFLTRAPTAFIGPGIALWYLADSGALEPGRSLAGRLAGLPWRRWLLLLVGFAPSLAVFFGYNLARFGSPWESGYALATLPDWLLALRAKGLFSLAHVPMNLELLFLHLPGFRSTAPWILPDGLGMSVFLTSPGLLLAARAPWRDTRAPLLLVIAVLVLIPTLLYYGGGWFQFGYRYFLDSIPFVWALGAMGVAARGWIPRWGWVLIAWSVAVGVYGVWFAYHAG